MWPEILTLQALALRESGEEERAVSTLAQALTLAEPEGYVRTFVDEGPQIATLLAELLEAHQRRHREPSDHPSAHYLRKLLAALEQAASGTTPPTAELPEPLSERELEVLITVTVDIRGRPHSPGAVTRIERALKMAVEGKPGRGVRLLPRTVRMNLNEPPGSTFWPMSLRPVRLYVHSRKTYATRRYQEVKHSRDAIEAMNHVRQREGAERKGS